MIKKIKIENFQSHRDTELEFSKGVNVITGLSNSGKTAIIRAFQLLKNNRPLGFRYNRTKNPTKIEFEDFDGNKAKLTKTKKEAIYKTNTIELKKIGSDVP